MSEYLEKSLKEGVTLDRVVPISTKSYQELAIEMLRTEKSPAIKTGFAELDDLFGGFENGRLYVLSAPTKSGKTTFAQTIMYRMAKNKQPSLFFSYEMGNNEVVEKFYDMDRSECPIAPTDLPLFMPIDLHRQGGELQYLWMFEAIAKAKRERGIKLVVIDHLHFLLPLRDFKNTSFIIGGIVREIKRMAVLLEIPIILICHIAKIKDNKVPDWTDIRDSSFITQEADVVFMLYRCTNAEAPKKTSESSTVATFTNEAIFSVELDRVRGKSGKLKLFHNGVMFEKSYI